MSDEETDEPLGDGYSGWAPCVHSEEDKEALEPIFKETSPSQAAMEILWLSNRGDLLIDGDQWFAVIVEGQINHEEGSPKFRTYIQCDRIEDGLVETMRIWRRKYHEETGREWDE